MIDMDDVGAEILAAVREHLAVFLHTHEGMLLAMLREEMRTVVREEMRGYVEHHAHAIFSTAFCQCFAQIMQVQDQTLRQRIAQGMQQGACWDG
jgi:hypothetical protein